MHYAFGVILRSNKGQAPCIPLTLRVARYALHTSFLTLRFPSYGLRPTTLNFALRNDAVRRFGLRPSLLTPSVIASTPIEGVYAQHVSIWTAGETAYVRDSLRSSLTSIETMQMCVITHAVRPTASLSARSFATSRRMAHCVRMFLARALRLLSRQTCSHAS